MFPSFTVKVHQKCVPNPFPLRKNCLLLPCMQSIANLCHTIEHQWRNILTLPNEIRWTHTGLLFRLRLQKACFARQRKKNDSRNSQKSTDSSSFLSKLHNVVLEFHRLLNMFIIGRILFSFVSCFGYITHHNSLHYHHLP